VSAYTTLDRLYAVFFYMMVCSSVSGLWELTVISIQYSQLMAVCYSVCRSYTWCKGKAAEGEGPSSHANQSAAHYNEEDSLWWRVEDMGSLPDAHSQASYWPAQSFGDC